MQRNQVEKRYQALVKGQWPKGKATINAPVAQESRCHGGERVWCRVDAEGKASVTHFKIEQRFRSGDPAWRLLTHGDWVGPTRYGCIASISGQPIAG